jgi:hypothetical protein
MLFILWEINFIKVFIMIVTDNFLFTIITRFIPIELRLTTIKSFFNLTIFVWVIHMF